MYIHVNIYKNIYMWICMLCVWKMYQSYCRYLHVYYTYVHIHMCIYICASACSACEICLRNLVCIYIYSRICIYTYVSMHIYTGWRRLIGSLKLQIIFHKRATKYRSLLQKMTYKDKGSYESLPPCMHVCMLCV